MDEAEAGRWGCGEELLTLLFAATRALDALPVQVSRLTGPDLDAVLTAVDGLAARAAAGRFTLIAEANERGEVACSQAGSLQQWIADRCLSLEARDAGVLAKAVRTLAPPSMEPARTAVAAGRLSVAAGCVVAAELTQLRPLLEPGAEEAVLAADRHG